MTVEEYFEEWWTPKELPEKGFNKTAMLDFAEMYHKKALRIHDVVGLSEQLKAFVEKWNVENDLACSPIIYEGFVDEVLKSL